MESEWRMEYRLAGQSVGAATVLAHSTTHGWQWQPDIVYIMDLMKGIVDPRYSPGAFENAGPVFKGADLKAFQVEDVAVNGSSNFDEIHMHFVAWSEDDLKKSTCTIITAPDQARLEADPQVQKKQYTLDFSLSTAGLPQGKYLFIAGAQDNGWYQDAAAASSVAIWYYPAQ